MYPRCSSCSIDWKRRKCLRTNNYGCILHFNPYCDAYGVGSAIATLMVDYSLDIVEVNGQWRAKRGKMTERKKFLEFRDDSRTVIPAKATPPERSREVLKPLDDLYAAPPSASEIRDRVLSQLETGNYGLDTSP